MEKEHRSINRLSPSKEMPLIYECGERFVGRINNLSRKGLAFEYDSCFTFEPGKEITVKIALDLQSSHIVEGLRCIVVYDIATLAHGGTFRGANTRLCGLKFAGLTQANLIKLDQLMAVAGRA